MRFKVINLARTPQRLFTFKKNNPTFIFERFAAIDGTKINRQEIVDSGLFTEKTANRYTDGAIGVALSHRQLWQECVTAGENFTILEDDAVLIANFNEMVNRYTSGTKNWDFIFWGANLDQRIVAELSPGIAAAEIKFNQPGVIDNINRIKTQNLYPSLFRVHWAVGLVCYTITPKTAQYLLDNIFPIRDYFDFRDNHGVDNSIIEELSNMASYICFPPIALTLNDRYNSTVQENNPPINSI
jgi:GR25 family glycosyltransferase involved in LPS biosynthesis